MNSGRKWIIGLSCLMLAGAVGCGPEKNDEVAMLTEERDRLRADLDKAMADLAAREAAARDAGRSASQSELDSLRSQLLAAQRDAQAARDAARSAQGSGQATPEGWTSSVAGFDMISIQGEVLFDSGKATLRPAGRSTLDRIASDVQGRYANHDIYVFGHTDNDPIKKSNWKDNWELGSERALTIVRYLVSKGIPAQNVIVASCGENRPRESGRGDAIKQKNRRVEFYAVDKARGGGPRTASALRAGE